MIRFRYACRRCGHSIVQDATGWVHVDGDCSPLHVRCRAASRLRQGVPDDRLPKTAIAAPAVG